MDYQESSRPPVGGLNVSPMFLSSKRLRGTEERRDVSAQVRVLKFAQLNVAYSVKFRPRSGFIPATVS